VQSPLTCPYVTPRAAASANSQGRTDAGRGTLLLGRGAPAVGAATPGRLVPATILYREAASL